MQKDLKKNNNKIEILSKLTPICIFIETTIVHVCFNYCSVAIYCNNLEKETYSCVYLCMY